MFTGLRYLGQSCDLARFWDESEQWVLRSQSGNSRILLPESFGPASLTCQPDVMGLSNPVSQCPYGATSRDCRVFPVRVPDPILRAVARILWFQHVVLARVRPTHDRSTHRLFYCSRWSLVRLTAEQLLCGGMGLVERNYILLGHY